MWPRTETPLLQALSQGSCCSVSVSHRWVTISLHPHNFLVTLLLLGPSHKSHSLTLCSPSLTDTWLVNSPVSSLGDTTDQEVQSEKWRGWRGAQKCFSHSYVCVHIRGGDALKTCPNFQVSPQGNTLDFMGYTAYCNHFGFQTLNYFDPVVNQ